MTINTARSGYFPYGAIYDRLIFCSIDNQVTPACFWSGDASTVAGFPNLQRISRGNSQSAIFTLYIPALELVCDQRLVT